MVFASYIENKQVVETLVHVLQRSQDWHCPQKLVAQILKSIERALNYDRFLDHQNQSFSIKDYMI